MVVWDVDAAVVERVMQRKAEELAARGAESARREVISGILHTDRIRSGAMMSSVHVKRESPTQYRVGTPVRYGRWQEFGRGPVVPIRARVLRFRPKGVNTFVFAKRVRADPGGHFFARAVKAMRVWHFTR